MFLGLLLKQDLEYSSEVQVSSSVLEKVIELLSDRCQQVQVAAAITLYTLNKATQKVRSAMFCLVILLHRSNLGVLASLTRLPMCRLGPGSGAPKML